MRTVLLGPVKVADAPRREVVEAIAESVCKRARPVMAFALHVGGLTALSDEGFVSALNAAEIVYADGAAVVCLAKLHGARHIERAATTDIGLEILAAASRNLGRRLRVALVGGPPGLTQRAALELERLAPLDVVAVSDGFRGAWDDFLAELHDAGADVLIVGMGMPKEAKWASTHRERLTTSLVLTCGGWFGFLVGDERRAPRLLQAGGLEWLWRMSQSPRRLWRRYLRGAIVTVELATRAVAQRIRDSRRETVTSQRD